MWKKVNNEKCWWKNFYNEIKGAKHGRILHENFSGREKVSNAFKDIFPEKVMGDDVV